MAFGVYSLLRSEWRKEYFMMIKIFWDPGIMRSIFVRELNDLEWLNGTVGSLVFGLVWVDLGLDFIVHQ